MARFYSNENFPHPAVVELRKLGHDVLTSLEAGNANRQTPDAAVLAFATSENPAVLTINRKHFIALHNQRPEQRGIVVCSMDADFVILANRIDSAISGQADLSGKLIRVDRPAAESASTQ